MEYKKLFLWQKILPPTILSLITLIFYYPSLWYGFLYDDLPTITKNIHVLKAGKTNILSSEWFTNSRWISRFLNKFTYKYWQTNPFAFRIINLIIHISIGIFIFFILLKLLGNFSKSSFIKKNSYIISLITSGIFLLHPTQTQTVTYITQMRLEGLVVFFTFAILLLFIYASLTSKRLLKIFLYLFSFSLVPFATCTKEIIVVMPLLILLVDWFFISQGKFKKLFKRIGLHILFFTLLFGTYKIIKFKIFHALPTTNTTLESGRGNIITSSPTEKITPQNFGISQFKVILHYIKIYFWPFNLSFDYDIKLSRSFWNRDAFFPFLLILFILSLALIVFIKNKTNIFSFCVAWFFISTIPRTSIIPSAELVCDYKTYLSSFGIIFLISIILFFLIKMISQFFVDYSKSRKYKISIYTSQFLLASLIIILSGYSTKIRNKVWSSDLEFWTDVIKKAPNKARAYNNYAASLSERGRKQEAMEAYKKSSELDPTYSEPIINMAFHYQAQGKDKEAMKLYKKSLTLKEAHPEMFHNLGILHLNKKTYDAAEICFKLAIKFREFYSKAHFNLGLTYYYQNKLNQAFNHFSKALDGDYQNIHYYFYHAKVAESLKKIDIAIKSYEEVKKIDSNYKLVQFTLGSIYYEKHDYLNAAKNFGFLYKKDKTNNVYAYNYAQSLLNISEFKRALPIFNQCGKDENKYPHANIHAAKCLAKIGKKNEAIKRLTNTINNTKIEFVKRTSANLLKEII